MKAAFFLALRRSGILAVWETRARGVPVLAYHGVTSRADRPFGNLRRLHVPSQLFERHLRLMSTRWRPISLSALRGAIVRGIPPAPRSVVITIDDGYRNTLTVAEPLLRRYGVPATLFVLTPAARINRLWIDQLEAALELTNRQELTWEGSTLPLGSIPQRLAALRTLSSSLEAKGVARDVLLKEIFTRLGPLPEEATDDRDLLSWDEVRELRARGLEIGSHADLHEPLTSRPAQEVDQALRESRKTLERELGPGEYALSYPYGALDPGIVRAARESGFSCALTGIPGLNSPHEDLFRIRRHLIGADDDETRLRTSLSGLRALWSRPVWS